MHVSLAPVAVAIARSLRARVRVHVVAGNDVHTHVRRWPRHIGALSSRHRHRCLAATVMEQIDVRIAEVTVRDAIDDIVKARFAQSDPGTVVEDAIGHIGGGRMVGQHNAERQPEGDEYQETVEIGAGQRQVPGVREAGLKVGRAHESFHIDDDAHVSVESHDKRQQHDDGHQ